MLYYVILLSAYFLGLSIFLVDEIQKYQDVANANPDPSITYKKKSFWKKEKLNIIRMLLLGIVSIVVLPLFFGSGSFQFSNKEDVVLWSIPMKVALIPIQIVVGWTGGRIIIALLGKSKQELYKQVGIIDEDDKQKK